ncbi:MAG: hypothetical protein ABI618_14950 [Nitrospirota bacterium]
MPNRESNQRDHELAVMTLFMGWLGQHHGITYKLISRPDPPDGIFETSPVNSSVSSEQTVWVEVADIYRSGDEAHEERSFANPSEQRFFHSGPIYDPDAGTATALLQVLLKKLSNESYHSVFQTIGPGLLLCCERDPLFDGSTLQEIKTTLADNVEVLNKADKEFFKAVYLYERPNSFHPLLSSSGP